MNQQELKRRLWEYPQLEDRLKDIYAEITSVNAKVNTLRSVKSPILDGLPHSSGVSDPTYRAAQLIVDEYECLMDSLLEDIKTTESDIKIMKGLLKRLSPEEYKIIDWRYFKCVSWDYIPGRVYLSRSKCFCLRNNAFRKMLA